MSTTKNTSDDGNQDVSIDIDLDVDQNGNASYEIMNTSDDVELNKLVENLIILGAQEATNTRVHTVPTQTEAKTKLLAWSAQREARASGCPCFLVEPCSYACTCANSTMSGGCQRCCKYGSMEQQLFAAKRLSNDTESTNE